VNTGNNFQKRLKECEQRK